MKAVPGILPTLLEMICFFSTPTIDVEPKKGDGLAPVSLYGIRCLCRSADYCSSCSTPWGTWLAWASMA